MLENARVCRTEICVTQLFDLLVSEFLLICLILPNQERLDRAAKSCQDSIRDQMSSDTSTKDHAKYEKQFDDCVSGQVDQHLARLPNLIQKVILLRLGRSTVPQPSSRSAPANHPTCKLANLHSLSFRTAVNRG